MLRQCTGVMIVALSCAGCSSNDRDTTANRDRPVDQDNRATTNGPNSAEARILSLLHAKNQEEIEAGRLARERGQSQQIRDFGAQLVRDHTDADARVRSVANQSNVTLMSPAEFKRMSREEMGGGGARESDKDTLAQLRQLRGAEFDREFTVSMRKGHREVVQKIQRARNEVSDQRVLALLDEVLPVYRNHAAMAMNLNDER